MLLLSWVSFPPPEEGKYMKRAKLMSIYILYMHVYVLKMFCLPSVMEKAMWWQVKHRSADKKMKPRIVYTFLCKFSGEGELSE